MTEGRRVDLAGAAHLVLAEGVHHLQPEEAVLAAMLDGPSSAVGDLRHERSSRGCE